MKLGQKGISLIEVLIVVLAIGFLVFLIASIPNAISLSAKSGHLSLAQQIALKQIEDKRAIQYENLANGQTAIVDSRLSQLPSGAGTVVIADCTPTVCTNDEEAKSITVTVTWKEQADDEEVEITTLIGEGGLNQ